MLFVVGGGFFFFEARGKKGRKGGGGEDPYGNREQEQKHTETAPVSQCSRNMFLEHSWTTHR